MTDPARDEGPPLGARQLLAILLGVAALGTVLVVLVSALGSGRSIGETAARLVAHARAGLALAPQAATAGLVALLAALGAIFARGGAQIAIIWIAVVSAGVAVVDRTLLAPPRAAMVAGGALELERARHGGFELDGRIDGVPVRFLVDTGASITAVPQTVRARLGAEAPCEPRRFETAAGPTEGCVLRGRSLELEGLRIEGVEVAVLPRLQGTALLGMNVLGRLHVEQRGRTLRLAPP